MALALDLNKAEQGLRLSLKKAGIITPPQVDLAFNLDVSGSFDDEHRGGLTNELLVRLVPWGMVFDPDKKMEVFTFSDGPSHVHHVGDVTPGTCDDYVRRKIIRQVPGYNGGTDYSYVLERNLERFGWKPTTSAVQPKRGIFGGFFGGGKSTPSQSTEKKRSIVIHVTDGEIGDKRDEARTERVLADSEARQDGVYFLFLGVSNQPSKFEFIERLGDRFDNVGFVSIRDVGEWVKQSHDDINQALLGDELLAWLKS